MVFPEIKSYTDPRDLLHRFVPTPVKSKFRLGSASVLVETNDFTLLPLFPLDNTKTHLTAHSFSWKLVRDIDSLEPLADPITLVAENLTTICMGSACFIGVDHERREILLFIGSAIAARDFHSFVVPLLSRLTEETLAEQPSFDGAKSCG